MNRGMLALIRKDLRSVTANHRMLVTLLVVPLVLTVFLPTVAVVTLHTAPEEAADFQKLLALLPVAAGGEGQERQILNLLLNYVLPLFFLIIPVMTASVMASASFVGEREKHTLETLLYGPLSLRQVFRAKVLAAFTLSMGVSLLSFGIMLAVFEGEVLWLTGQMLAPAPAWLLVLLLVAPAVALIAIPLMVRLSVKAKSAEDAQQGATFLLLPVILLLVGQFSGVLLVSPTLLLVLGLGCAGVAALLMRRAMGNFTYERFLQ